MRTPAHPLHRWLLLALFTVGLAGSNVRAADPAGSPEIEAILVWATNTEVKPESDSDEKLEKLDEKLAKNLSMLKWKNYYVINRERAKIAADKSVRLKMSKKCEVTLRQVDEDRFAMELHGEGVEVGSGKTNLKKGEVTALGGDSENDSAWMVVLVRRN